MTLLAKIIYPPTKIKQTRIDWTRNPNGSVLFVGFENVYGLEELANALSSTKYEHYFDGQRSYYSLSTNNMTVRCYSEEEFHNHDGTNYRDYCVGATYSARDWEFFEAFLKDAGARLARIKHGPDICSTYI